jgi:predicted DNA binding CopG/RHH family protein
MAEPITRDPIPITDSIDELARFWDSHEITDYEDELEEVDEEIFEIARKNIISIPLQSTDIAAIHTIATKRGISSTKLLTEWVREKIAAS